MLVRVALARLYILGLSRKVGRAELGCGGMGGRALSSELPPCLDVGEHSASRQRLNPGRTRRFRSLRKPCALLSHSPEACAPQCCAALRTRPPKYSLGPRVTQEWLPGACPAPRTDVSGDWRTGETDRSSDHSARRGLLVPGPGGPEGLLASVTFPSVKMAAASPPLGQP